MGVHVGLIGSLSGAGTVTVTGIPFQPAGVVFWNVFEHLQPPGMMFGCATADDEQWVIWAAIDSEISTYFKRYNEGRTDACILNKEAPFSSTSFQAEFVGFTSDGFTIDVTTFTDGGGQGIHYMALGGHNIGDCHAGTFTAGSSTGTTGVTDPGFLPSALIVAHQLSTFDTGQQNHLRWGVGVTDGTNQYSSFVEHPVSPGSIRNIHRTAEVACGTSGSGDFLMELDSFDASGFTVNVTDASTGNHTFGYLAIDAAAAASGFHVIPDATGTQDLDTPGFLAQGVFFTWNGVNTPVTTGSSATVALRPGVGAATATGQGAVELITRDDFPFGVVTVDGYDETNSGLFIRGQGSGIGGADNDILALAEWDTAVQGTVTLDWTTAQTGFDRAYGWLALPGDLPFSWVPNLYRRQDIGGHSVPPIPTFLLLEDGSRLILEDDSGFLLL